MPRFFRICLILLLASAVGCRKNRPPKAVPVAQDGRLELRMMSFNIRYENDGDVDSRSWQKRVINSVRMIRDEAPDIIGVQEALHGQTADLWASLPDYEFFGAGRDDGKRAGEYSGIFYRRDRFEADPRDCGTFWLSDTPETPGSKSWGNEIPRVASWLRLVDRSSGRGFYVFNTHWDHRNQPSRERASLLLAQRTETRRQPAQPVVLLGDFNAVENNPAVAYLSGRRVKLAGREEQWQQPLINTFDQLHPNEAARTTLHFWNGSRGGSLKVDHILASKGAQVLAAGIRDKDEPMVSDHFPVTARVVF
jgi:endonuclease/exonuclease/phosphatase family metal-dependent hydrolase